LGLLFSALSVRAQAPEGSGKLTPAAVAESLVVLRQLDSVVRNNPRDAATWYRRGMVAWALYERDRSKPPIGGLDWTRLGLMADTSLRLAAMMDQNNGQYRMMAGRFLLNSGVSLTRAASYGMFTDALDKARKSSDPHVHSEAAIEVGRLHWRRYETYADQWLTGECHYAGGGIPELLKPWSDAAYRAYMAARAQFYIGQCMRYKLTTNTDFQGEADYVEAETFFREAFDAQPTFERAYRQFAMLLVERNRWRELEVTARARIKAVPWDAWAWLTLGLSVHRQTGDVKTVAAAFDSAYKLLPTEDVRRLDRLERVMKPRDSSRVTAIISSTRAASQDLYWMNADPLWSRLGNEPRIEFLARVTYAELRWTVEEMKVRGADTDRGDVHIRYGPPDLIVAVRPGDGAEVLTTWAYQNGLSFGFAGLATFATSYIPQDQQQLFGDVLASVAVTWDNATRALTVDSMPAQFVRFRAARDSVDLYIATLPPVERIKKSTEVAGAVRSDFWLMTPGLTVVAHDTVRSDVPGLRVHERRLGPGTYVYRAEASTDGGNYAARAGAFLVAGNDSSTGFTTRGFGMSDVLLAASASSRGTPLRWNDLNLQPMVGTVVRKGQIALVWENYELGNDGGSARYTVSIAVERQRSLIGRIAAQIVGRVGAVVGVDRTEDRVTSHYERNTPYAPAILENIALGFGDTPVGNYRLTITIADHVSGRTTARSLNIAVTDK
jgi:GWxTD domain-containing protein